jgi:hypothetical protein
MLVAAAVGALFFGTVAAQTPQSTEIEQLRGELKRRDAVIDELRRRVEALERATRPPEPPAPGGPAMFEVDAEAAERALERTLTQSGALLLERGQAEIAARFALRRGDDFTPALVIREGQPVLATVERRRDALEGRLDLRLGLGRDSQLELGVPYRYVRETDAVRVGFQPSDAARRSGSGWGDLRLAFAKTLLREAGSRPDVIGRFVWHAATGERESGGVALGGGFHGFEGELAMVKRLDPLVFVAGASAAKFRERDAVGPGNQYTLSFGTFLAASPEASLRLVLQQVHVREARLDGRRLPGSDRLGATFTTGASVILGPRLLFDVAGDIGVTKDAPDYALRLTFTRRFDMPWR